jgi:acetylornithine/succinyldiaminopimelate/putrescine aminotransferase
MEESLDRSLSQVESALAEGEIGAVIVEPIQGRGGIRIPPSSFLYELLQSCRAHDSILIVDEIFTGFYRTGPSFACSEAGIEPDIVLVGKALGGGMPIGACIGTKDVMDSFGPSPGEATHTETFLGHPLSMASASALLDVFSEGGLEEAVRVRGRTLGDILNGCVRGLGDHIRAVRGRGLMWGIEVSEPSMCSDIVLAALKEGLILLGGGLDGTVVQFTPPLTITEDELATFEEKFLRCVKSLPNWDEAQ